VATPSEPKKPEEAKASTGDVKLVVAPADAEAPAKGKAAEKADKPARLHQPNPREKIAAEKAPAKPAATPAAVAAVNAAPPVEANPTRDANDLARAAIERLRNSSSSRETPRAAVEAAPRLPEPLRAQETPHAPAASSVAVAPPVAAPMASAVPVAPLPPAVNVAPSVAPAPVDLSSHPVTTASVPPRGDDPLRPTPPAEIPASERIEASADSGRSIRTVGDDVFSAARSVIHAVIPR
jgi:hypothetical protein